jgi:hypothetical protein
MPGRVEAPKVFKTLEEVRAHFLPKKTISELEPEPPTLEEINTRLTRMKEISALKRKRSR